MARNPAAQFSKTGGALELVARVERLPLEKAQEAFARMESGHAQFRVVLAMG